MDVRNTNEENEPQQKSILFKCLVTSTALIKPSVLPSNLQLSLKTPPPEPFKFPFNPLETRNPCF